MGIWRFFKKINAKVHLRYKCPRCKPWKRQSGDIFNKGECHWYKEWEKGNYDVPLNIGWYNYVRILILRRKINHKQVYWRHMPATEKLFRLTLMCFVVIGFVLLFLR